MGAKNQVFASSELAALVCELQRLIENGKPAVVRKSLTVLPNHWWGIVGGFDVDVVLVYNEVCKDFQSQLPAETQAELAKGSSGGFASFPHYKTMFQNEPTSPIQYTAR